METNDIKNIWKSGLDKHIKTYSDSELKEIVVKSARKSIKAIMPGGNILRYVVVGMIIFLIATLLAGNQKKEIMIIDFSALVVIIISYFFWERSTYKMQKYTSGMPVREWLEYRIKEVEKSIRLNTKYNIVIYGLSLFAAVGFYVFYQIFTDTAPNVFTIIIIPTAIIVYLLFVRYRMNRNYQKALSELNELYKELNEKETFSL